MAVFFDMDGTLHRQDSFVAFLLPHKSYTTLTVRCIGNNKVTLLKQYLADNHLDNLLPFNYGFSDSHLDLPMLALCQKTLWVNKQGEIHHQNT